MAGSKRESRSGQGGRASNLLAYVATLFGVSLLAFRRKEVEQQSMRAGRGSRSTPASPVSVADGYEVLDANVLGIVKWAAMLAGFAITAISLMVIMVNVLDAGTARRNARLTPEQTAAIIVPLPHLQAHPYADLHAEREHEDGRLSGYAWIGADHAAARIPISRAMALSVGRSLDFGPATFDVPANGQIAR